MRPYIAVLKDSFHEALASRVLWILLILVTLFLVLLAPAGLKEVTTPVGNGGSESTKLYFSYLGLTPWDPLPLPKAQVMPLVKTVLASLVDFIVGTFGVFAAVLVTAPIIPHTFEAGAIDLLLSKPVSRSLLFVTKFLGGCAFILLIGAYFIIGLWLIVGFRLELWNPRFLLCIPLFVFLFAVYYSVSALAGVVWRNAIVSVVITILFWGMCFGVGLAKNLVQQLALVPHRIVKLVPAGETLFAVTESGQFREWQAYDAKWADAFAAEVDQPTRPAFATPPQSWVGPVYDQPHDRLIAIQMPFRGPMGAAFGPAAAIQTASRADGWKRKKGPAPPSGTSALFVTSGGEILAVGIDGVSKLVVEEASPLKLKPKAERFVSIGPEESLRLDSQFSAAFNSDSGEIAIMSRGVLVILERDAAGQYERKIEKELAGVKKELTAVSAFSGTTLLIALSDGRVLVIDSTNLVIRDELTPARGNPPRFAAAAPGGRWLSVLFHSRDLWLFDGRTGKPADVSVSGQGDISAATFSGSNTLLVADRGTRVTEYQVDPWREGSVQSPTLGTLERTYYYGIVPIYTIFPKPGELGNVVQYLLTDQETVAVGPNQQDLNQTRVKVDVAGPLWSSLAFLVVVLAATCVYVGRSDF